MLHQGSPLLFGRGFRGDRLALSRKVTLSRVTLLSEEMLLYVLQVNELVDLLSGEDILCELVRRLFPPTASGGAELGLVLHLSKPLHDQLTRLMYLSECIVRDAVQAGGMEAASAHRR